MNADSVSAPSQAHHRRPKLIWVISGLYVLSAGWTVLSFFLVYGGLVPQTEAESNYFANLTALDHFTTVALGLLTMAAAIFLFLLRRVAVTLFALALTFNILFSLVHALRTSWVEALGSAGLVGAFAAWLIMGAIYLYARRQAQSGVLR